MKKEKRAQKKKSNECTVQHRNVLTVRYCTVLHFSVMKETVLHCKDEDNDKNKNDDDNNIEMITKTVLNRTYLCPMSSSSLAVLALAS